MKLYSQTRYIEGGIDEAGRGCYFGRVYTALVCLPLNIESDPECKKLIKDSKALTPIQREKAFNYIMDNAIETVIDYADVAEIEEKNILWATVASMNRCIMKSFLPYGKILIDGDKFRLDASLDGKVDYECVVSGDAKYYSIAAASILAKVSRDRYIYMLTEEKPELEEKFKLRSNLGYHAMTENISTIDDIMPYSEYLRSYGIVAKLRAETGNITKKEIIHGFQTPKRCVF